MFLFFYGNNSFLIRKKIHELEKRYHASSGGDFNLSKIEGENLNFENFAANVQAVPLLSTSRLIEVFDLFKNKDKNVHEGVKNILDKIPDTTVLVFVEYGMPDKRLSLFKALSKSSNSYEFKDLAGSSLGKFIKTEVSNRKSAISEEAISLLQSYVGGDLWQLANEIDKLTSHCEGEITPKDVENLVSKNIAGNVFELIESMARRDRKKALFILEGIITSGEPPLKVLATINYQFRVIAQIKDAMEKYDNDFAISKACSLAPFQVTKNKNFAKLSSWQRISDLYENLISFDEAIKSGKIDGVEGLKELVITL